MKSILLALLVVYSLAITQHFTTLGYSGDKAIVVSSNQQGNAASGPPQKIFKKYFSQHKIVNSWKFLTKKPLGDKPVWITPKNTQQIYPCQWVTVYTLSFNINCPKNPVILKIASTGVFQVYLNDVLVQDWYNPWYAIARIALKGKCGENKLKIVVFNQKPSPSAIIYLLTQSTNRCPTCKNPFKFNDKTCTCECIQTVLCTVNNVFDKKLCKCVSKCPIPQPCPKGKIWDAFNCQCICQKQPVTCPGAGKWNPDTCSCFCVQTVLCIQGLHFDNKLCQCVKTQTTEPYPKHKPKPNPNPKKVKYTRTEEDEEDEEDDEDSQ